MEPITNPNNKKTPTPVDPKYKDIYDNYLKQTRSFWVPTVINFTDDKKNFKNMPLIEQDVTKMVLSFFSKGDELINENLSNNFLSEITQPEITVCLTFQEMMEDIHSQVYNRNIHEVFETEQEIQEILDLAKNSTYIDAKIAFAHKYMNKQKPLSLRIAAFIFYEGIAFSGSFAWIDWLKECKYELTGMFQHNDYISNDEFSHTTTGAMIEDKLLNKASNNDIKECLLDLQNIEINFWRSVIPIHGLSNGMTRSNMSDHIKHCANICAHMIGRPKLLYNKDTTTPFKFLTSRSLSTKFNFFEKEGINYHMGDENNVPVSKSSFDLSDDF